MEEGQFAAEQKQVSKVSALEKLHSALNLASRMPPSKIHKNLVILTELAPEIEDSLLEKVETPLQIEEPQGSNPFLKTQFNRDGDSYRSPFTNSYYPPAEGFKPQGFLRKMEQMGCVLFQQYTKLYYGGNCVSNFFVAEGNSEGRFSCGFFAKKRNEESEEFQGNWDSFNVVDVINDGKKTTYNISSTVLIEMKISTGAAGAVDLTGFLKKQVKQQKQLKGASEEERYGEHMVAIGELIEENETKLRQHLEAVYVAKTKQVVFNCRLENTVDMEDHRMRLAQDLKNLRFKNNTE